MDHRSSPYVMMGDFLKAKPVHEGTNLNTFQIRTRQELDRWCESATQLGSELGAVLRGFCAIRLFTSAPHRRPPSAVSLLCSPARAAERARNLPGAWRDAL